MINLRGIPASPGYALSNAFVYKAAETPVVPQYNIEKKDTDSHWQRLEEAVAVRAAEIEAKINTLSPNADKTRFDILTVHLLMLNDPEFLRQVKSCVFDKKLNIEWAVWEISQNMMRSLMECNDELLRERAVDISDMANSLIRRLMMMEETTLADIRDEALIVAYDIMPSDMLSLNHDLVKGIVLASGSYTSHLAILARSFGIPAVLGLSNVLKNIENGKLVALDGISGDVFIDPDDQKQSEIRVFIKDYEKKRREFAKIREKKAVTKDEKEIVLKANIQIPSEADRIFEYGAEGIGLFRTEFMFLTSGMKLDEEGQTEIYTKILKKAKGKPVTIRTCDAGGDKITELPAYNEKNPLLGLRAIRLSLAMPQMFKTQLRALLRAGVHGVLRIMFPMISGEGELDSALKLLEECKTELRERGAAFNEKVPAGIMIEVPSAAVIAGRLACKCAFFSIGTNDLMQYTLAVDRGNESVSYLADPRHPAFLRLIKMTADAAHKAGISVSVCGEIGGRPDMVPLLMGLGVDEFSMNAAQIPEVKKTIMELNYADCVKLAKKSL